MTVVTQDPTPEADLVPGVSSRIVTVNVTELTEGYPLSDKHWFDFALTDSLDSAADGMIIARTNRRLYLQNGYTEIRLPTYDADAKTPDGSLDWEILVTSSFGYCKKVRVPAGTTKISLAALPDVEPLNGLELQYALTGASVTIVQGAQWGATIKIIGGVLTLVLTVPPGAEAWDKTASVLTAQTDMSSITPGIYRVGNGTVATALGLPVKDVSALTVVGMGGATSKAALLEHWGFDGKGGVETWRAWRNNAGVIGPWEQMGELEVRLLNQAENGTRLGDGIYGVLADRLITDMPPRLSGTVTEGPVGDSTWSQMWQTWTVSGSIDLLTRSQSTNASQTWQRPESPRAVEWTRQELAALQASLRAPNADGSVPSSAWTARASETVMKVPTPDGTGQATHPSVVDVPGGWNGHRYWMAYTPYAYANDALEDPCVAWSDNGAAWTKVDAAFPLDDAPGSPGEFNSDTNMVLHNGTMYVIWRRNINGLKFWLRTSTDGVTWTPRVLLYDTGGMSAFSPSLVKMPTGWRMWFIGGAAGARKLAFVDTPSEDPTTGWGSTTYVNTPTPAGREPWHVEVHRVGGRWWGLLTDTDIGTNGVNCQVRLMQSADGLTWDVSPTQLIPRLGHSHDVLYKTAATITGDPLRPTISLWYSGLSADQGWWLYRRSEVTLHEPRGSRTVAQSDVTGLVTRLSSLEQDTGWRNITPVGLLTSGRLLLRRRGPEVTVKLDSAMFASPSPNVFFGTLPGEYRPTYREREAWYLDQNKGIGGTVNLSPFGSINMYDVTSTTSPHFFSARYYTAAAWPTTNYGDPA